MFHREDITPEWLTSVLRNNGFLKQGTITKVQITRTFERFSSLYFLEITPSNIAALDNISRNLMLKIDKYDSEGRFFRIAKDVSADLPIPRCYNLKDLEQKESYCFLLDDLSKTHEEVRSIIPPSEIQYKLAINSLAIIHAKFWDHSELYNLVPDKKIMGYNPMGYKLLKSKKQIPRIMKQVLEFLRDKISEKRKEIYRLVASQFIDLKLNRLKLKKNLTLTHGDAWLGNFLLPKQYNYNKYNANHQAYIIDWGMWSVGFGPNDLAHMIGLNWPPESRKNLEKDLVKHYLKELVKNGINDYSWDDCWHDYRLGIIGELLSPILWCYWKLHPDIWTDRLEYSYQSFKDLKCLDIIKES
jgi:thiamine kinase-like enzyme